VEACAAEAMAAAPKVVTNDLRVSFIPARTS